MLPITFPCLVFIPLLFFNLCFYSKRWKSADLISSLNWLFAAKFLMPLKNDYMKRPPCIHPAQELLQLLDLREFWCHICFTQCPRRGKVTAALHMRGLSSCSLLLWEWSWGAAAVFSHLSGSQSEWPLQGHMFVSVQGHKRMCQEPRFMGGHLAKLPCIKIHQCK